MTSTINQHGEKVTVIGTISDGKGGRIEVKVTQFGDCFALTGTAGGHPDARRFSTQVRRAKFIYADECWDAKWNS